jgi:predicted PurR-regulated permease PerM
MQTNTYGRISFYIVFAVVLYYVYRVLAPFLSGLVWAGILATVFRPFFIWIRRRVRRPRLASTITCVLLTVAIVLPVLFLVFKLAGESVIAYRALEEKIKSGGMESVVSFRHGQAYQWMLAKMQEWGLPEPNLTAAGVAVIRRVSEFLVTHSASVVGGFTRFALNFFVMLFSLYYLFLEGPQILRKIRDLSPLRPEHEDKIFEKFRGIALATFGGSLATAAIQGTVGGIAFGILGLPSPLLWGAAMAFLSLVPVVGTALVWGPVVLYYFLTGAFWKGILLFAIFGGVVGTVDNIVKPILMRRGTEMNTLLVFLSVLGGVAAFGFLGFFLGPFILTLLFLLIEIYEVEFRDELNEKAAF